MFERLPSRTALATAFLRAAHVRLDDPPPVLDDRLAARLLPAYLQRYLAIRARVSPFSSMLRPRDRVGLALRGQVVVRARYAEDGVAEARRAGVTRYVILGAGLDTYALRQPAPPLDVLEIDHPATQRWKQQLLRRSGIAPPPTLTFLPVDFERSSLREQWIRNPEPDFISWLGTTYYLSRDGIADTLKTLAEGTEPGSQLVLDYWRERPTGFASPLLTGTRIAVAFQGEPMQSFFDPPGIEKLAVASGWQVRENCTPAEQARRYLKRRRDGLSVPSFAHLLWLEK